jgi:putative DNA primase/helicase
MSTNPTDVSDLHVARGLDAVKACIDAAAKPQAEPHSQTFRNDAERDREWPELQPLVADTASTPYPAEALPDVIRAAVAEVQGFVQAPVALVGQAAIAAASAAVQALYEVERAPGLKGPVSLYMCAIAASGERKTSCDRHFSQPFIDFELETAEKAKPARNAYKSATLVWEAKKKAFADRINKAIRDGKSTAADEDALANLVANEPKAPHIPKITAQDTTTEALANRLAKEWPSVMVGSTEGGTFFGSHAMTGDSLMRALSLYNVAWDGLPTRIERKGTGETWIKRGAVTLNIQVQEGVIRDFLYSDRGLSRESGFVARTLWSVPESTQGTRKYVDAPRNWPGLSRFTAITAELLRHDVRLDEDGGLQLETLRLSSEARDAWVAFHDRIEAELAVGGALVDVRDVAAKIADNAARLAAIFRVYERKTAKTAKTATAGITAEKTTASEIDLRAISSSIQITEWHLGEARRFFGGMALPREHADATALEDWLKAYCAKSERSAVPMGILQKLGPTRLRDKQAMAAPLDVLVEKGRARVISTVGRGKAIELRDELLATAVLAVNAVIPRPTKKAVV